MFEANNMIQKLNTAILLLLFINISANCQEFRDSVSYNSIPILYEYPELPIYGEFDINGKGRNLEIVNKRLIIAGSDYIYLICTVMVFT